MKNWEFRRSESCHDPGMRFRHTAAVVAVLLFATTATTCQQVPSVYLIAPAELAGATVYIDGREAGTMKLVDGRAYGLKTIASIALVAVGPGKHEVRVMQNGRLVVHKEITCPPANDCYPSIESQDIAKFSAPNS